MTREKIIRILLVDDVELVRHTLRTTLSAYPQFAIVGEACDGEEALAWVQRCDPPVVVMDIQMPRLNVIQATAGCQSCHWWSRDRMANRTFVSPAPPS